MRAIEIKTAAPVVPMIYAYTTPEIRRHDGWTKIGYTEQDVETRIKQQTHTADVEYKIEWRGQAVFDDGSGERFRDTDFHAYLRKLGYTQEPGKNNEWFEILPPDAHDHFHDFRESRGILQTVDSVTPYTLRREQAEAVRKTVEYFKSHEKGAFLWNAKPRFGKTLSAYDFCKEVDAKNVLIVTNRPSIANSWYSDYERFFAPESGYQFVSNASALQGKKYVLSREQYTNDILANRNPMRCIEFISLQDLKGSIDLGGKFDKNKEIASIDWDVLIVDEAHEGVDTYKTDTAFNKIKRRFTLHLSGTPFKALANDKFGEDAIYNWTYADEQKAKREWNDADGENPYATLPQLNLLTYQLSEIVQEELRGGVDIDGEQKAFAFDLNEFFATDGRGNFLHDSAVDRFLDAMTTQVKFPFSTDELRDELKHTIWLLNRVDSAKALQEKLEQHPVFGQYKIVLAAGDGKPKDEEKEEIERNAAFDRVNAAIAQYDKTITLSVGQLTTGVTIPEWTAIMMLSGIRSPSLYMQAAFRAQNPCLFKRADGSFYRKKNAYVFDFDPARTLILFEEFANDLISETADGRGDSDTRKQHVRELLNFFPVIGEDENGEMVELDAEKVLSIPRKLRSQEVVKRGFMCNYLFQNISNIFSAPKAVMDILSQFTPVDEPKSKNGLDPDKAAGLPLDENGNVQIEEGHVIGLATDIFGEKIYDITETFTEELEQASIGKKKTDTELQKLKELFAHAAVKPIVEETKKAYTDMRPQERNRLERNIQQDADKLVEQAYGDYSIERNKLEYARGAELKEARPEEKPAIREKYQRQIEQASESLREKLHESVDTFVREASKNAVRAAETSEKEKVKESIEDDIRDHLRGFARTIPSFLMAYGTAETTLENFDEIIPDSVFCEVTSVSLAQFRFLRDGGDYTDEETGEIKHFEGKLFDPVVFNDSVREFLHLRKKLANYFEEQEEDIFDYVPPQKNNQIFTPRWVVAKMVDLLEEQNPGCFDDPTKTFADLYMKSGLYITEIVKRLYRSEKMKAAIPDDGERIKHILRDQVYGMAPTEIIYRIATNYILGFDPQMKAETKNFVQADAAEAAKNGTLQALVDEKF
ncbi:MAG: DEAD/DEAH box helicase family protein [Clostridiales bacterium]|nr:DEAD/DEAH box helicase family protein [Clostridiales bacterium]